MVRREVLSGIAFLLTVVQCLATDIIDICLVDSIYIGHEEGILGVDLSTINNLTERPCVLRIETCSSCQLSVEPHGDDFYFNSCPYGKDHSTVTCTPGCEYIYLFDAFYRNKTLKFYESSQSNQWFHPFQTTSSGLYVGLCHKGSPLKFQLKYTTRDKWMTYESSSKEASTHTGKISSPFFPDGYMQNSEKYTYYFQRKLQTDYVYLMFDDWNLAPGTEFFFENSNIAGPVDGGDYRPVVVSDSGHDLRVIFTTGRASNPGTLMSYMGYKATYQFVSDKNYLQRPLTQCGGYFLNSEGGQLKFVPKRINAEFYDCVWVIKTHPAYTKTYLKLESFNIQSEYYQGEVNYFELRRGLTSEGTLLGKVYPTSQGRAKLGFDDPVGFYIRLVGKFRPQDSLKLSYASFTEDMSACVGSRTFKCSVDKCISMSLTCDGTNHCGDNSDEIRGCSDSYDWHKNRQYTITVSVIIPMVIAVFLIIILCVLFVLVRRCRRNQMQGRCGQDGVPSVSGDVSRRDRRRRRRNGRPRDAPPSYEEVLQNTPIGYLNRNFGWSNPDFPAILHPPSYEEVIGSPVNQESSETINHEPGNISPSSSESSQSDISNHHRNRNSLMSDSSINSSRMRPSVHSYSMSYSSDSEMDSPRVNREVRGEPPILNPPPTPQIENANKIVEHDIECCQVSEHDVRTKTGENKPLYDSVRNSDIGPPHLNIHEQDDNGCLERTPGIPKNDQIPGLSDENNRTSASTQTRKKKTNGKRKKDGSKQQQNACRELDYEACSAGSNACLAENIDGNQRETENVPYQGATFEENRSSDLAFNFSHFNVNTYNQTGHDNFAFSEDENIFRNDHEERSQNNIGQVTVPESPQMGTVVAQGEATVVQGEGTVLQGEETVSQGDRSVYGASDLSLKSNLIESNRDAIPNTNDTDVNNLPEQLHMNDLVDNVSSSNIHIDTVPVMSHDGQNGGYLALLHEGNDEDVFV